VLVTELCRQFGLDARAVEPVLPPIVQPGSADPSPDRRVSA